MQTKYTVTKLSLKTRTPVTTIRYYEKIGVLKPIERSQSGYRIFDDQAIKNMKLVKIAQNSGLSLKDIKNLITIKGAPDTLCAKVQEIIKNRLDVVLEKAEEILRKKAALKKALKECESFGTEDICGYVKNCNC